jgi:hypothetical protein
VKVKELIEELEGLPEDADVHYSYNYGDYWHTNVAPEVTIVETGFVKWSEYHRMPRLVEGSENEDESEELVVVLS